MGLFSWMNKAMDKASEALTGGDQDLDEVGELYSQLEGDQAREAFEEQAYEEGYKIHMHSDGSYYFVDR